MRLIFLGSPGAGKGTQAAILAQQWQIAHIDTGEMLRQQIMRKSPLGLKAGSYVEKGELVPDDLVLRLVQERLNQPDAKKGWILHGFPRNLSQAQDLDRLLQMNRQSYDQVFLFFVPFDLLEQRMIKRGRLDDNPVAIKRRLEVYQEQVPPLLDYYRKAKCLSLINGDRSVETITQYMLTSIQTLAIA